VLIRIKMFRFLLILAVMLCGGAWSSSAEAASRVSRSTDRLIWKVARQEGVDPYLLRSMVAAESAFNPSSVSKKGAVGLMQLMPRTARSLGVTNRYNPEQNLRGGARYIKQMLKRFTSVRLALAAYNAGPTTVKRFNGIPPFAETKKYIANVLRNYAKFRPGANRNPKRIYRYKTPNGTLLLTNRRPPFNSGADWRYNQRYSLPNATPMLTKKRRYFKKLKTARMAPDIPAKPRFQPISQQMASGLAQRTVNRPAAMILASAEADADRAAVKNIMVVREINEIPIIRLSRQ
jgi:hypothetical protein